MPDLQARVIAVLAATLDRDAAAFQPATNLRRDLGVDSVDLLSLVGELEDAFGIKFPSDPTLMTDVETVSDLVGLVRARVPA